jgi:hypothetical protein
MAAGYGSPNPLQRNAILRLLGEDEDPLAPEPPMGAPPSSPSVPAQPSGGRRAPGDVPDAPSAIPRGPFARFEPVAYNNRNYQVQSQPQTSAPYVPGSMTGRGSAPDSGGSYHDQELPSDEALKQLQEKLGGNTGVSGYGPGGMPVPPIGGAGAPAPTPGQGQYQTPATGSTVRAKDQFLVDAQAAKARGEYNAAWVRAWVAAHPEWEIQDGDDPLIRMKQDALDKLEPGQRTVWQDVIRDSGGANDPQFMNADGYDPEAPAAGSGGGNIAPSINAGGNDVLAQIMAAIEQLKRGALMNGLG